MCDSKSFGMLAGYGAASISPDWPVGLSGFGTEDRRAPKSPAVYRQGLHNQRFGARPDGMFALVGITVPILKNFLLRGLV